jgi:hypothetical protein
MVGCRDPAFGVEEDGMARSPFEIELSVKEELLRRLCVRAAAPASAGRK